MTFSRTVQSRTILVQSDVFKLVKSLILKLLKVLWFKNMILNGYIMRYALISNCSVVATNIFITQKQIIPPEVHKTDLSKK